MSAVLGLPTEFELREEVRAILTGPAGLRARQAMLAAREETGESDPRPVYRLLGRHSLLAPGWPAAYGGRDLPATLAAAVVEEMILAGVSDTLHTLSVQICGTFLLSAGTEEQRAELLPALARGQRFATVLYTEPAVGSDLSALTTRAEGVPGGWRLTGQKRYSVRTALADIALVAARTSDESTPYQGISLFLVPLDTPGSTVRTLPSLASEAFGEVTFDGALVEEDTVVGPVGGAWPLITAALALERTGVDHVAKAEAWLRAAAAGTSDPAGAGRLRTRVLAAKALSRECAGSGAPDPVVAAATKLWCSETAREVATWCAETLHERALWTYEDPEPVAAGRLEAAYREAPGLTISAGTSEMMLELVAGAGLSSVDIAPPGEEPLLGELRDAARAILSTSDRDLLGGLAGFAGLGPAAVLAVCEEAGAVGHDAGFLDSLTAGCRAALAVVGRPGRPVTHPGADGEILVVPGTGLPEPGLRIARLPAGHPGIEVRQRRTSLGPAVTLRLSPQALADAEPAFSSEALAADFVRRAAWLTGLGMAALTATVGRVRTRRQFGKPVLDNQSVAFRLARLAVRARAVRALCRSLGEHPARGPAAGALAEATDFARAATAEALQLHGAFGMLADSPVAGLYRAVPLAAAGAPAVSALRRFSEEAA